jgi:hypothetical protein
MLVLTCPYCGVAADETELAPGGAAHLRRAGPVTRTRSSRPTASCATTPGASIWNAGAMPTAAASGSSPRGTP